MGVVQEHCSEFPVESEGRCQLVSRYHGVLSKKEMSHVFENAFHSHLSFFPYNLGAVNDKHGERFHYVVNTMKESYNGRFNTSIMGGLFFAFSKRSHQSI